MAVLNKARLDKPFRNRYKQSSASRTAKRTDTVDAPLPLLNITEEIASAAALIAEAEALSSNDTGLLNSTASLNRRASPFWMEGLARKGTVPWGNDPNYKVFRNVVTHYQADPTGQRDSTAAIQKAIDDGKRCGEKCNGSTTKNAIVYLPPGRYLVSSTLKLNFGTQLIGDANDWPRIVASSSFVGLGVLSTDIYTENGGNGPDGNPLQWYINTARFYSQIRNLRVDITATDPEAYICAVHYQVAQATTIENVELIAKTGTTQQGMFAENGSGGVMSDITFTGGNFGFYGGSQQFSASRMTFNGCKTAAQIIWDWGWVWKGVSVNDVEVGFRLISDDGSGAIGSVSFVDSSFTNIKMAAIYTATPTDKPGSGVTGLILDNVYLEASILNPVGKRILGRGYYKTFIIGPTYTNNKRTFLNGQPMDYTREKSLLAASPGSLRGLQVAPYFDRPRNQYLDKSSADFVHLKDGGAKGDGSTDDTKAVQDFFNQYGDGSKIIFVDAGTYILTDTVTIPKDAKIVGETWSQFAASGSRFADLNSPRVMLKVGNDGDVGTVEMQDLILTTKGGTAGAVLMEWNVKASSAGAAALWDVHARVGGATGTDLTPAECPPITSGTNPSRCQAASMLLHITKKASGYFDNMWLWVADHIIDDPLLEDPMNNMEQISVYSARGVLIESQTATWLYGTSSEHNVFYQYNFHQARNIYTTMIQTESPYYQPTPKPPAPFESAVGNFVGDPNYDCRGGDFDGCDESWAVIMTGSQEVHIGAAGTYSWFSTYSQDCIDSQTCQKALWLIDNNYDNNRIDHIIGIGAKNVMVSGGEAITAADNLSVSKHPSWSQISVFEVDSKGQAPDENQCLPSDEMFSKETMPSGNSMPWHLMGPENAAASTKYYVTIVNLTPYRFVKDRQHSYQFDVFDFGDVPSGKSRQNTLVYTTDVKANPVDDNGEAYYSIQGTDKKFTIRGTTHIPDNYPKRAVIDLTGMGQPQREYGFPEQEVPVTLVITGSEEYGYITSVVFGPDNWMHQLYDVIKDRELRHLVMPGSHDAGMSTISYAWDGAGTPGNSQNQGLNIYDQLRVGSRWFDMRLVSVKGGGFWAAHVNDEVANVPVGATGESLDDIIAGINRFTSESPGEIIIWWVKYMVDLNLNVPAGTGRRWSEQKANEFYTALEKINNRCPDLGNNVKFDRLKAQTLLDKNNGAGCVLIMTDGRLDQGITPDRPSSGIYRGRQYMDRDDYWAEKTNEVDNSAAQVSHMEKITRSGDNGDSFYIMQWQPTPDIYSSTFLYGLQRIALMPTNPALYWRALNSMKPNIWPTVIMQDYIGLLHLNEVGFPDQLGAEIRVLCIGLNLYMVSQNCKVSKTKHPLLQRGSMMSIFGEPDQSKDVIYANGTVVNQVPAGFHLGRAPVLKAGTSFGNGTILAVDTLNPDFGAEL
ncbi:hypothetical protein MAPG_06063 [Magnaporthiopsis poae ATCC 64411]|uniref:Rhamnogalacturonase A/B/Epimerase-like pectate lyase domain-containing protein n=1 Tax=Magnaporthiopsis poae (strain ATCC 64411 / 73-15) TaxID=644358 RepID=A0A0C4E120_MAGP6|nr:hypothetical protein MAPG_06063 [Magnaporthiopsis poae ATCC 64411]